MLASLTFSSHSLAQDAELEQRAQLRLGVTAKKKFNKRWSVGFGPELRTDGIKPERYLYEVGATYEPIKYVDIKATLRGDLLETKKGLDYGARPGFSVTGVLPLDDFKAKLRVFYTYSFGHLRPSRQRLRYQASLAYNVPKIPLNLELAAEAFHRLDENILHKMRYGIDLDYKIYKSKTFDQFLYAGYALDYYLHRRLNVHLISTGYKVQF